VNTAQPELLPVLPLDDVVVLPHMTVTLGLEGSEQRAAVEAARQGSHLVLLVPRIDGRFATVGTVAGLGESGSLPNGSEVQIVTGEHRAKLGHGQAGDGA
jgi:ATP-dependent Lon protease